MPAATTLMLAATAHGLASTAMEGFRTMAAVRHAVALPDRYAVAVVVAIGHAKRPRPKRSWRRPLRAAFHANAYDAAAVANDACAPDL